MIRLVENPVDLGTYGSKTNILALLATQSEAIVALKADLDRRKLEGHISPGLHQELMEYFLVPLNYNLNMINVGITTFLVDQ